jgi:hypothetical protein
MTTLTAAERTAIIKRVKDLDRRIQDPRLSISRVDELHKRRAELRARLLADRLAADRAPDP